MAGTVCGRGAIEVARTPGANISNIGTMAFSGQTDIRGDVHNAAPGRVIAAGGQPTTFWDDVVNDGEIIAGEDTVLVYFGSVSGTGNFP